jgi:hypothetical protein
MKRIVVLITLASLVGCTTLRPLAGAPADVRDHIARDRIVAAGDHVRVTTVDGRHHDFVLVRIADGQLVGPRESIAIDDVVALSRAEPSPGKTLALVIVITAVLVVGASYLAWQHAAASY